MSTWTGRPALRGAILVVALTLFGCEIGGSRVSIPLSDLAEQQELHDGRRVETRGVVRRFGPEQGSELHYVIEDDRMNRVQLVPAGEAERFVSREVVVTGEFRFEEQAGRRIIIQSIEERS